MRAPLAPADRQPLLLEGMVPDPQEMASRVQEFMEQAASARRPPDA